MSGGGGDFVWIKLATAKEDAFAYLSTGGFCVGQVAGLACSSLGWGLTANKVRIYLVAESGEEPGDEVIETALAKVPLDVSTGVTSGAWLVAMPTSHAGVRTSIAGEQAAGASPLSLSNAAAPGYLELASAITRLTLLQLDSNKALAELKRKSDLAELEKLFVKPVQSTGASSQRSPRKEEHWELKQRVVSAYNMQDPNDAQRCFTHMGGPSVLLQDATMAHIWPSSEADSAGLLADELKLPNGFHIHPRNFLLLPEDVHKAFDHGWLLFLPIKAAEEGLSRVFLRALHLDSVTVAGDPDSPQSQAKRAWLRGLDGSFLTFRNDARPFMRVLGWRAWTTRVAPSGGGEESDVLWDEEDAEERSVDAEGNKALKGLITRGKGLIKGTPRP